ncbi:MAG: type transport system permease protein [Thermoleophilaceae bacterium]|jgi:ABC-2 type transport system permease protein|nr:type transport system permease protein [Thermoleophilaceae bacterium]
MSLQRLLVIARHNARLLTENPGPVVLFIFTPLLTMAILRPTFQRALVGQGFPNANGAEQVVPGFISMFVFFWMIFLGRNFFAEHGWGTWSRLQTSEASPGEILVGKVLPAYFLILTQMLVLFGLGTLLFNLHSEGPPLALLLIAVPLAACVLALTLALVGLCRVMVQVDALGNLLVMVFASLGGAFAPVSLLPDWARQLAPAVPSYWANKAARSVILEGHGVSDVLGPAGVILLFTVAFGVLAAASFRFAAPKIAAG